MQLIPGDKYKHLEGGEKEEEDEEGWAVRTELDGVVSKRSYDMVRSVNKNTIKKLGGEWNKCASRHINCRRG